MIYLLFVSNLQNCLFICLFVFLFCFCLFGLRNYQFLSAYEFANIYTCLNISVNLRKKNKFATEYYHRCIRISGFVFVEFVLLFCTFCSFCFYCVFVVQS